MKLIRLFLLSLVIYMGLVVSSESYGYNDELIGWIHNQEEALIIAEQTKKPIVYFITKKWCSACKRLKSQFQQLKPNDNFIKMSEKFIMVHLPDQLEPKDDGFSPDGGYIPRLIFANHKGKLQHQLYNLKRSTYRYFYSDIAGIISSMETALKTIV